jgi:hypothetical protein
MGCKSDISFLPSVPHQDPLLWERNREQEVQTKKVKRRKRDIPLNNPIYLIRFPTSFPNFSNYYIRIYPIPK